MYGDTSLQPCIGTSRDINHIDMPTALRTAIIPYLGYFIYVASIASWLAVSVLYTGLSISCTTGLPDCPNIGQNVSYLSDYMSDCPLDSVRSGCRVARLAEIGQNVSYLSDLEITCPIPESQNWSG